MKRKSVMHDLLPIGNIKIPCINSPSDTVTYKGKILESNYTCEIKEKERFLKSSSFSVNSLT